MGELMWGNARGWGGDGDRYGGDGDKVTEMGIESCSPCGCL